MKNLTLRAKLTLAFVAVLLGLLAISLTALLDLKSALEEARRGRVKAVTQSAMATLDYFQRLQSEGALSESDAKQRAIASLRQLRFDGDNYIFIADKEYTFVLSPAKPDLEGKSSRDASDQNGKPYMRELVDTAVGNSDGGYVAYVWVKPGHTNPVPKVSYATLSPKWGWVIGAGAYLDDVSAAFWQQAYKMLGVAIPLIVLIVAIFLFVSRSILKQLGGEPAVVVSIVQAIASGDLRTKVDLGRADSASMLAAVSNMRDGLVVMLRKMAQVADAITGHAQHISTAASQVAAASQDQAHATSSSAAALEEVTVSINEVSEIASASEERANETLEKAAAGEAAVSKAATEVAEVERLIATSAQKVEELKTRSDEIGSVASVIKDIADQTNLLALNAAIEAARAGEQGRGFAVVADEVRKLAERTSEATTRIASTVQSIQVDTEGVVRTMQEAVPQVQASMTQVHEVAQILSNIRHEADDSAAKARDVAQATREQGNSANELAANVERIASMAEEVSATMGGNAGAANEMQDMARELKSTVSQFKLP